MKIGQKMKVTAAIFRDGDKVLLMRRAVDQPMAGEWEYPGGKFEDGEDGPTCLHRELSEELGIDAQVGDIITIAKYTTDSARSSNCTHTKSNPIPAKSNCASMMICTGWWSQTCRHTHNYQLI